MAPQRWIFARLMKMSGIFRRLCANTNDGAPNGDRDSGRHSVLQSHVDGSYMFGSVTLLCRQYSRAREIFRKTDDDGQQNQANENFRD